MQAKSKVYLRQFEQDNIHKEELGPKKVMEWFNNQVVKIVLTDVCKIKEISHSKYGSYQFKTIYYEIISDELQQACGFGEEVQVWTSYDGEKPYRKTLILGIKCNMFLSDQYAFILKEKSVLWVYDFLENPLMFSNEKINLFKNPSSLLETSTNPFQDTSIYPMSFHENLLEVSFTQTPQQIVKYKVIQVEGLVLKLVADHHSALFIQHLPEKTIEQSESERLKTLDDQIPLSHNHHLISQHFSNMFRSISQKDQGKNQQTLNIVELDLKQVKEAEYQQVHLDLYSNILKYLTIPPFQKFEVVITHDGDSQKRLYVLEKKIPQGFRMIEIEREVITPIIDNDLDLQNWHYDLDTHRLSLLYKNETGQECVKVLPFKALGKNAATNFGGDQRLNKIMDLIQRSELSFEDEVLSSLDGKVFPVQSYINYDNFVIVGHGSSFSYKDLSILCDQQPQWNHKVRKYETLKSDTQHYSSCQNFSQDIHYFFMAKDQLYIKYADNRKTLFQVKNGEIIMKNLFSDPLQKNLNMVKGRELLTIKDLPHFLVDTVDEQTGGRYLCCLKPDQNNNMQKLVFKVKIEEPDCFNVLVNRQCAIIAIIYQDYMTMHKLVGGKSDAIVTIQFQGTLQDIDLNFIESYHINEEYIYILSKDIIYIINLTEQKVEDSQQIGTNVKHFLIFENKFIYWLERGDQISTVKFDYFNPQKYVKLIDCELFSGANQLNSNQYEVLQRTCEDGYVLKKFQKSGLAEYIALKLSVDDETNLKIVEDKKILFNHSKCSEIRGTTEKIKFSRTQDTFLAWSEKRDTNIFIIYKFLEDLDPCGYNIYYAVSVINHQQQILFSPNFKRFLEFDYDKQIFIIQKIDVDPTKLKCLWHSDKQKEDMKQTYSYQDYFRLLSPQTSAQQRFSQNSQISQPGTNTNKFGQSERNNISIINKQTTFNIEEDYFKLQTTTIPLLEDQDKIEDEQLLELDKFSPEQHLQKILHKNFKTIELSNIPLSSLKNKFNFMKNCPLAGNSDWPLIFCCDSSIIMIVDNFIVKKYMILEDSNKIEEISTVIDWQAVINEPYFEGEPPKFYENHGIVITKNMAFNARRKYEPQSVYKSNLNKFQQQVFDILPITFDLESLVSVEPTTSGCACIGEYMIRDNRRYLKRKRILFQFTFFNWYLISKLQEIYKTTEIPQEVLRDCCKVVLPQRKNILFYAMNDHNLMTWLFNRMQVNYIQYDPEYKHPMFIPFFKDESGKTPLHYSLQNAKITDQLLNYLADYPLTYYSENMKELVPYLIIKGLQKINYFLDKRFKQTPMMLSFDRERLKFLKHAQFTFTGRNTFWFQHRGEIADDKDLFDEDEFQIPMKVAVLDLPNLVNHSQGDVLNIFTALRTTEQMDIFECEAVRAIIEYSWPITRKAIIKWMMIPSLFFLAYFIFYTTIVFPMMEECSEEFKVTGTYSDDTICHFNSLINSISKIIIMIFLMYFLAIEVIQSYKDLDIYFSSPWNYLDIISILFVSFTIAIDYLDVWLSIQRPFFAFATLIIWLKSLYYLRIFRNVGYLTSMIIQVIQDMVYFFIILVMSIFAFGNSFYVLSQSQANKDDRFIKSYPDGLTFTFRLLLGDFETANFGNDHEVLVWILFSVASIFLIVVLLNLLISIISESYSNIQLNAKNSMYKELASLIYDNYFLTNYETQTEKYIILAKPDNEYIDDIIEEREKIVYSNNSDKANDTEIQKQIQYDNVMDKITGLSDEMSEIKILLLGQQQYLENHNKSLSNKQQEDEYKDEFRDEVENFDIQRFTHARGQSRQSLGFGESDLGGGSGSLRRIRRGTQLSNKGMRNTLNLIHVPFGGEQKERRKQSFLRTKNLDIFQ